MSVEIPPATVRVLQLDLLERVHEFCALNEIDYALYAGTLLGAVRHGGFIPWDDDIDIMMPRPDYERFCREFPTCGDQFVVSPVTESGFPHAYAKVCRAGTLVVEDVDAGYPVGVNIDIFPVDVVSAHKWVWRLQRQAEILVRNLMYVRMLPLRRDRTAARRLTLFGLKTVVGLLPASALVTARSRVAQLCQRRSSDCLGILVAAVPWRVPSGWVVPTASIEFEGRMLRGPAQPLALLERIYGDFMVLPPDEQRVSPHQAVAYVMSSDSSGRISPESSTGSS